MSSITIPAFTIIKNHDYKFHSEKDGADAKLTVSKKETEELVYSVAIEYFGYESGKQAWSFSFKKDGLPPRTIKLWSTQTISFKVADNDCIRICAIDEKSENIYYTDLTEVNRSLFLRYRSKDIRQLISLAEQFVEDTASKENLAYDVLFHDSIVLIVFSGVGEFKLFAAEPHDTEFVECTIERNTFNDDYPHVTYTVTLNERKYLIGTCTLHCNNLGRRRTEILEWERVRLHSIYVKH